MVNNYLFKMQRIVDPVLPFLNLLKHLTYDIQHLNFVMKMFSCFLTEKKVILGNQDEKSFADNIGFGSTRARRRAESRRPSNELE